MERDLDDTRKVWELLDDLKKSENLKKLFWTELNYDRSNKPIPWTGWNEEQKSYVFEKPVLYATGGAENAFHIIYTHMKGEKLFLTRERSIIERLLKEHPYSLFIFSNEEKENWHFVNVKLAEEKQEVSEYNKKPERRRLFRRITIGPDERLRTASERISLLNLEIMGKDIPGLPPLEIQKRHDEAFDVEKVTRDFYKNYRKIFEGLQKYLSSKTKETNWAHDYALQFLNRLMFLYFVQKKRWMNNDPNFLNNFWKAYKESKHKKDAFFEKWLNVLFFEAFNNKYEKKRDYFPQIIHKALKNAPFLNGGLFSENSLDSKHHKKFLITDDKFEEILGFLEHYNFTISEDTPLDQEVAVDAEMLGKVYEMLVNVSSEANERGDAGIFYTPRTEIDLMCRISLVDFLNNHLEKVKKSLLYELIFAFSPEEKKGADQTISSKKLWKDIDSLLGKIRVLDPACGSGSFLVGMLTVLDDLKERADKALGKSQSSYDRRKRIIGESLYGVDVMQWAVEVAELRLWLQLVIETNLEETELKKNPLLPNLSFKIRQGDSLIQEIGGIIMTMHPLRKSTIPEKIRNKLEELKNIKMRFYNGNPKKGFETFEQIRNHEFYMYHEILDSRRIDLVRKKTHFQTIKQTEDVFSAPPATNDIVQSSQIKKIDREIEEIKKSQDALKNVKQIPFLWNISFVEIFEGERKGFDIVIGNPPYVRQENIANPLMPRDNITKTKKKEYKNKLILSVYQLYPSFFGNKPLKPEHKLNAKSDLYIYFFFHGISLLNPKGSFCFITSNSWLDVGYGADLQEFLLKHSEVKMIIDNRARRSFEADVNTVISLFSPTEERENISGKKIARFINFLVPFEQILSPVIFEEIEEAEKRKSTPEYRIHPIDHESLFKDGASSGEETKGSAPSIKIVRYIGNKWGGKYLRAPDIYWTILKKGKGKLVRLRDVAQVRRGFTTGANEFFYLNKEKIREWGIEKEFLKPVIKSPRECKRILIDPKDLKYKILMCHKDKKDLKGTATLEYIKWGESQGFHERESCKGRKRWWEIVGSHDGKLAWAMIHSSRHSVHINTLSVELDHNFFEIIVNDEDFQEFLCLYAISILGVLMKEIVGRQYGGGSGPIKTEGIDIIQMLFLYKNALNWNKKKKEIFKLQILDKPYSFANCDSFKKKQKIDSIIFDELELTSDERDSVYESVIELVEARLKKARSL